MKKIQIAGDKNSGPDESCVRGPSENSWKGSSLNPGKSVKYIYTKLKALFGHVYNSESRP